MIPFKERLAFIAGESQKLLRHFSVAGILEYACIFCQSEKELAAYQESAEESGTVVEHTSSGNIFRLTTPIVLKQGTLRFLKIRRPDPTRPEQGDCDYAALPSWEAVFSKVKTAPGFKLIERENYKMIELTKAGISARAYFSNPTLSQDYGK